VNKFEFAGQLLQKKEATTKTGMTFVRAVLTNGDAALEICCFGGNKRNMDAIKPGSKVKITGILKSRTYVDKNGETRYGLDVRLDNDCVRGTEDSSAKTQNSVESEIDEIPF